MSKDNSGPAFPTANPSYDGDWDKRQQIEGMTLRDYFAIESLHVIVSGNHEPGQSHLRYDRYKETAIDAYRMADAMLEARK